MRTAVLTYVDRTGPDNKYSQVTKMTLPYMREYARKCQSAFILPEENTPKVEGFSHRACMNLYRIDLIRKCLETYERVLWLDADVLIRPDSPSLFSLVPADCFAAHDNREVNWTVSHQKAAQEERNWISYLNSVCSKNKWPEIDISLGIIDTGVMLVNRSHIEVFQSPWDYMEENPYGSCEEMIAVNIKVSQLKPKIYYLPRCFNNVIWNGHFQPERSNYFIHYAGYDVHNKIELARKHVALWSQQYA